MNGPELQIIMKKYGLTYASLANKLGIRSDYAAEIARRKRRLPAWIEAEIQNILDGKPIRKKESSLSKEEQDAISKRIEKYLHRYARDYSREIYHHPSAVDGEPRRFNYDSRF